MEELEISHMVRSIRKYFENKGGFQYALLAQPYLISHLLIEGHRQNFELKYFILEPDNIQWSDQFNLTNVRDESGGPIFEFENDVQLAAQIVYNLGDDKNYDVLAKVNFTLLAYQRPRPNGWAALPDIMREHIYLLSPEEKVIHHHHKLLQKICDDLKIENKIDFDHLAQIWEIGISDEGQVHATSYYFYLQLFSLLEELKECLAEIFLYTEVIRDDAIVNRSRPEYNYAIQKRYFKKYLACCMKGVHLIYSFWEQISFLIYQFIKPSGISERNLSFSKLVQKIEKDINSNKLKFSGEQKLAFDWIAKFYNEEHSKIQCFRHPLVHYRFNEEEAKGNYWANFQNHKIENYENIEALKKSYEFYKDLANFILNQFKHCNDGFQKSVELISRINLQN